MNIVQLNKYCKSQTLDLNTGLLYSLYITLNPHLNTVPLDKHYKKQLQRLNSFQQHIQDKLMPLDLNIVLRDIHYKLQPLLKRTCLLHKSDMMKSQRLNIVLDHKQYMILLHHLNIFLQGSYHKKWRLQLKMCLQDRHYTLIMNSNIGLLDMGYMMQPQPLKTLLVSMAYMKKTQSLNNIQHYKEYKGLLK